jgi:hypothetical protein
MMKGLYSYWVTLSHINGVVWEGMVYAVEENGQLKVNVRESDPAFIRAMQSTPGISLSWEPAWKDITDERRLPSGSEV